MRQTEKQPAPDFAALLQSAVTDPGKISTAYFAFHNYSLGNQLLALMQCYARGIEPGPIATFPRWKELDRYVRKGEKAIELCQPVTCKRTIENPETGDSDEATFTRFVHRRSWFVLSQTDGQPYEPTALPDWNLARALAALQITETRFELMNGNVQGYARGRTIAVSPIATNPLKTALHEAAHVLLGHTETERTDTEDTPRNIAEVEAESVAMLVCAALNQPGIEYSRGYIQHWLGAGNTIPEPRARRIFKTADQILRAGREQIAADTAETV